MVSLMGSESTLGLTGVSTLGTFKAALSLGKASGERLLNWQGLLPMNITASMCKIGSVDMESSNGRQGTLTRETTRTTKGTAMERCVGLMEVNTSDSG